MISVRRNRRLSAAGPNWQRVLLLPSYHGEIRPTPIQNEETCPCPDQDTSLPPPASRPRRCPLPPASAICCSSPAFPASTTTGALPDSFEAQFANVVTNIKRVLDEAGATFRDLVKVNVLLTRASDVATMNVLYASRVRAGALSGPHHLRGAGAARSEDADRDRGRGVACGTLIRRMGRAKRNPSPVREAQLMGFAALYPSCELRTRALTDNRGAHLHGCRMRGSGPRMTRSFRASRATPHASDISRSACGKTTRRANQFRFTEVVSSPPNQKYFAFTEQISAT